MHNNFESIGESIGMASLCLLRGIAHLRQAEHGPIFASYLKKIIEHTE